MRPFAFLLLAAAAFAQDTTVFAKLDDYLTRLQGFGFSGVALVAKDGKIVLNQGYGLADRGKNIPMAADSVISIGSITKQFTAAAILKLEMQGKLRTTDSIARFFPDAPSDKKAITLHQLLTHTAGLRSDYAQSDYEPCRRDEYVERIFAAPLLSAPGETFRYANSGYSLLAAIVEIASGLPYERYLYKELFEPAGMTSTGYQIPKWPAGKIARGYNGQQEWGTILERPWDKDGPFWQLRGNGGIHTIAADMYRWHVALETNTILSKEARAKYETGYVNEGPAGQSKYAYGWSIVQSPVGKLVEHNGGNRVFAADFLRYVDAGVVVFVFSNSTDMPAAEFSHALARVALGLDYAQPPKPITLSAARLAAYAGIYALPSGGKIEVTRTQTGIEVATADQEAWGLLQSPGGPHGDRTQKLNERTAVAIVSAAKGNFEPLKAAFGDNVPPGMEQRQRQMWTRQQEENGKFQSVRVLGTVPDGPGLNTTAQLTFEHGAMYIHYMWTPEGDLGGMLIADQLAPNRYAPEAEGKFVSFAFPGPRVQHLGFELAARGQPTALLLGGVRAKKVE